MIGLVAGGAVAVILLLLLVVFMLPSGTPSGGKYDIDEAKTNRELRQLLEKDLEEKLAEARGRGASATEIQQIEAGYRPRIDKLPKD